MSQNIREKVREDLIKNRNYTQFKNYKFYVNDLSENLIGGEMPDEHRKMFDDASGSELNDKFNVPAKAKAIDSSSMLSYNFFRHISEDYPIEIDNIRYNKVIFEVRLRTLKASPQPANIDVVLISEDKKTVLFIESKFLEYLENKSDTISESYSNRIKYYDNGEVEDLLAMPKYFIDNFTSFIYKYGIKQNICHLIGISNLCQSGQAKKWFKRTNKVTSAMDILNANSYRFMNMVFSPSNEEAKKTCDAYIKQLQDFKESLPKTIKKYISPTFIMTYGELYEKLPYGNDIKDELQKRYINFHS